ncbi:MAG: hypothetical protein M5T61_02425 [Acidimicrobiia bacterium]|nr:hypothetical protein [Acidimicrobiia bacterium]
MTELDRIIEWCVAAGHHVSQRPGESTLALTLASGGAEGRIEPGAGGDPICFAVPVHLGDEPLGQSTLAATLDGVAALRGPLVEVEPGRGDGCTAEVRVFVYPDGVTRHAVLAALDELRKTGRSVSDAVRSARQTRALLEAYSGPEPDSPTGGAPPPQTLGADTDDTVVTPPRPEEERTVEAPAATAAGTPAPRWCYVNAVTEVRDATAPERVAGHLQPGTWYEALEESGGWLRVRSADSVLDGWVDATCANFEDRHQ